MKNNQDKEFKRWLKNKVSVTQSLMIQFLIMGSLSIFSLAIMSLGSNLAYGAVNIQSTNGNSIEVGSTSNAGIAIGENSTAKNNDISIGRDAGKNSNANGHNIVIGNNSRVGDSTNSVGQSVAIGSGNKETEGAWAKGGQSIAIGGNVRADGDSSIAIGGDDLDRVASKQIQYTNFENKIITDTIRNAMKDLTNRDILSPRWTNTISGEGAVAIGVKAAAGHLSLAIGTLANAGARNSGERIEYKAINTVAVGSGAEAILDNSVAIGGGSNTNNVGTKQTSATIGNIVYSWSGGANTAKGDIVSFGSTGFERQLKNVAAGEISETSTDGINGSQLYAIAKQITNGNYLKYLGDDGQNDTTKIINLSLEKSKLNIVGGADTTKLSDENIGVVYENGNNTDSATGTELKPNDAKYQEGKLKIKLSKELTGLTSAEFKDAAGNTSKIDGNGLTITPKDTAKNHVSITNDGINAGDKAIINVASNLPEETNDNKLKQDKPTSINTNNAATVGDVLNAGWNLQGNGEEKDFVKAYDTVNFVNGDGTTATVETTDNKVSAVKYSVNLGNGLEKDKDNKITIKPADKSLEVTEDGIKVKTGDNTLTTDENGLKVNTGTISPVETGDKKGTVKVNDGDEGKIATVDTVVNAINNASFTLKASSTTDGTRNAGSSVNADGESIKAGNTVELIAGKNLDVKHDANGKITFATKEEVNFNSVQLGKDGPKLTSDGDKLKVGDKDGNPTSITNVKSGLTNHTTGNKKGLVDLDTPNVSDSNVATVRDIKNLGWIVSSDKATDGTGEYSDQVKNTNEVKFVGKGGAVVSGKTVNGVRTITVEVNDQLSTNNSVTPVVYTKADGTQVYPIKQADGTTKFFENPDGTGKEVDKGDVVTSVNGPDGTKNPTTLKNIAGNLEGAKKDTNSPTTNAASPNNVDDIKNNAATVGDVLNAGWNLQGNGEEKDFVKAYDTVNFVNGDGTTATVETTDNKVSAVKYSVNLGNGLEKDKDNKITIKPADKSLEVTEDGIKVKTGDNTLTTDENGLKVNTGTISPVETGDKKGTVKVNDGDEGKIATVDTVVNAINNASFTLKASSTTDGTRNAGSSVNADGESIKAGNTVELIAGKNLDVKHDANGKITFATKEEVNFNSVQLGKDGPKLTSDGDKLKVGDKDGNPTSITNVAPGEISPTSQDAINGSQLSGVLKGINAGIASSVAMANLPQVSNIGMHRHNIAASVGVHRGESAFALGLSGLNHRGSLVYKASGALNTKGHVSFGIGIGYQFDRNTRDNDTHRNDIIDLKEKYEKLALENEQNKELIKQLLEMISKDARYNK